MRTGSDADRFPSRKSPRLKYYDYSLPNYYFVTICTFDRVCIFGKPDRLSQRGVVAEAVLREIESHFSSVRVDKYVVMPNHVHMILVLENSNAELTQIVGQYKSSVTREIRKTYPQSQVWQTSFHDHVIRNQKDYERIWSYIEANPQNWDKDCFFVKI